MMAAWAQAFLLLMMTSGGGDLLDFVPTDFYWRAKGVEVTPAAMLAELSARPAGPEAQVARLGHPDFATRQDATAALRAIGPSAMPALRRALQSDDPEVVSRAEGLLAELGQASQAPAVRRLMAIRTLGELNAREAEPLLGRLSESPEPFVEYYALRAIARIEGLTGASPPRVSAAALEEDLAHLPADAVAVGQMALRLPEPPSVEDALDRMGPALTNLDREEFRARVAEAFLEWAERIGNARIDSLSFGVMEGDAQPFAVILVRGRFDPDALRAALADSAETLELPGGGEALQFAEGVGLHILSGERALVTVGASPEALAAAIAAVRAEGTGVLSPEAPLADLLAQRGGDGPLWLVGRVPEGLAWLPVETVHLTSSQDGELLDLRLAARLASTPAEVAPLRIAIRQAKLGLEPTADAIPALEPAMALLNTVEVDVDGGTAVATARAENVGQLLLAPLLFLIHVEPMVAPEGAASGRP